MTDEMKNEGIQGGAQDEFHCGNLPVAAYVVAKGFKVKRIDRSQPRNWVMFVFDREAEVAAREYMREGTCVGKTIHSLP